MQSIDFNFFNFINRFAGRWHLLDIIMTAFAKYGPILLLLILAYLWFQGEDEGKQTVILAFISVAVVLLVNQIIGHIYFRPRPFADHNVHLLLSKSSDPSFPSDHATFSFAIAMMILLFNNKPLGAVAVLSAVLIALARVFVGTHYPFDVIGGAAIGSIVSLLIWKARSKAEPFTLAIIKFLKR